MAAPQPAIASSAVPALSPKTLMIVWHGRNGRHGMDKGIFSTHVEPEVFTVSDAAVKQAQERAAAGKPNAPPARLLKLFPGINSAVPAAEWEKVSKYDAVKNQLAAGNLEIISGVEESLASIPESRAISEFATYTIDKGLLERWNRNEQRLEVKKALEGHLAKLNERPAKQ